MGILTWILGIAWRTALICVGFVLVKHIIRNGGGTLKEVLETTGVLIRTGCIELRRKLVEKLKREDVIEENPEVPELRVEGTVK